MLTFVIVVAAVVAPLLVGIGLAFLVARFDRTVQETYEAVENQGKSYNPAVSLGHEINLKADLETQVKEARRIAAKRAAALPRGANMGIGSLGNAQPLRTAWQGVEEDPITAVKIAAHHGWDGVQSGFTAAGAAPAQAAPTAAAPAATGKIELVPGKDYPVTEITDDMSPAEVRKARIANAKAKSAAMKKAKEAMVSGAAAPAAAPATPAKKEAPAPKAAPAAANVPPPDLIEITDDMSPDEVRKARIANAKAKSAYNKALKEAGVDPKSTSGDGSPASQPAAQSAPQQEAAAAPETAAPDVSGIPQPDYIEITDDMSADEVRKARINNAKERSKYNKALKAAGIDPATIEN